MSSYLSGSIEPISKAIFSLWFRAPAAALQGLNTTRDLNAGGILPLLTFGKTSGTYTVITESTGLGGYSITTYNTPTGHCDWTVISSEDHTYSSGSVNIAGERGRDIGPSHLGIYKEDEENGGGYFLYLYLLTKDSGNGSGFGQNSSVSASSYGTGSPSGEELGCNVESHFDFLSGTFESRSVAPGGGHTDSAISTDDGGITLRSEGNDAFTALTGIKVEPDTWHHLLLSFDVSIQSHAESLGSIQTAGDYGDSDDELPAVLTRPCKIWAALDNVNHTGEPLRGQTQIGAAGRLGPNDFISRNTFDAAASEIGGSLNEAGWTVSGSWVSQIFSTERRIFDHPAAPLPTDPFGIPVAPNTAHNMKHVEMAEFQMWGDQTLDTGNAAMRRLFIDRKKNKDGKLTLQPVKPDVAEKALGKPRLLLHGSRKWIKGKNTGSGTDLAPAGKIEKYKPDPEIKT